MQNEQATVQPAITGIPGEADDFSVHFRAVKFDETRHGIRLERIYWNLLKEISLREGLSMGAFVNATAKSVPAGTNLTSAVRVNVVKWLSAELARNRAHVGITMVDRLVQACPSPVFALQEDKRIVAYNPAFLNFIQARYSRFSTALIGKGLRLALDTPIADLIKKLNENENRPIATGFALGMDDQRLRGRLSVILAPSPDKHVILGYIVA